MERIELKNGHVVTLNDAGFKKALTLFKVIVRELKAAEIDLSGVKTLADLQSLNADVIKGAVLQCLGSDDLERALFECACKCTVQTSDDAAPVAVNPAAFDSVDMRGDFFPIAWEVIKAFVFPFFAQLVLPSSTPDAAPTPGPK